MLMAGEEGGEEEEEGSRLSGAVAQARRGGKGREGGRKDCLQQRPASA